MSRKVKGFAIVSYKLWSFKAQSKVRRDSANMSTFFLPLNSDHVMLHLGGHNIVLFVHSHAHSCEWTIAQ